MRMEWGRARTRVANRRISIGLEFKHFIYLLALGCVVWAIGVSTLVGVDEVADSIPMKGELRYEKVGSFFQGIDKLKVINQALNVVLPLAVLCIAYLGYTYRVNPIGPGSIIIVVLAFLFAADSVLGAKDSVERDFAVSFSKTVWWMMGSLIRLPPAARLHHRGSRAGADGPRALHRDLRTHRGNGAVRAGRRMPLGRQNVLSHAKALPERSNCRPKVKSRRRGIEVEGSPARGTQGRKGKSLRPTASSMAAAYSLIS